MPIQRELYCLVYIRNAASGALYSLFVLQYSRVYMDQLELVSWLLVRLQYLSMHMGITSQLGCISLM